MSTTDAAQVVGRTKSTGSLVNIVTQYRRLLTDSGRADLRWIVMLSVIGGILEGLALLCVLVGTAALATGEAAFGLSLGGWIAVLAVLAVVGFVGAYFLATVSYRTAIDVMRTCHQIIGDKIARLPLGWFGMAEAGRYSRAMTAGMMQLGQGLAHMLWALVSNSATVVTLLLGLWLWQPGLGLVLTVAVPVYAVIVWGMGRLGHHFKQKSEPVKNELSQRIVEFASTQGALRSAGRAGDPPYLAAAIKAEEKSSMRMLLIESGLLLVAGMASQFIVVAMIVVAGNMAVAGSLGALETIAVIGVSLRLVTTLSGVGEMMVGLQDQTPTLEAIAEVLDAPTLPEPTDSAEVGEASVSLNEVTFGYDPDRPVLGGISFTMRPNTLTALVGPSGSGKTTIARLISRFYDVDSGGVMLGGHDVRDLSTADLMGQLSMVFQDVYLFDDTLAANVRVGRPDATEAEVHRAADIAGVTEIVDRLPDGWATRVGEGGGRLSGGERQRVSIARALLKQAPIVLVDEATSALDAENEANIQNALERLRETSTVLVIAHKLSTIRNADQIVVLDADGQVAQVGTHAELVDADGIYLSFWRQREEATGWALL
ncbi:MAG: ABC transporter ATP-binding protein [Propioniciclava sp.]